MILRSYSYHAYKYTEASYHRLKSIEHFHWRFAFREKAKTGVFHDVTSMKMIENANQISPSHEAQTSNRENHNQITLNKCHRLKSQTDQQNQSTKSCSNRDWKNIIYGKNSISVATQTIHLLRYKNTTYSSTHMLCCSIYCEISISSLCFSEFIRC